MNPFCSEESLGFETADNILSKDHIKKVCFVCTGNTCRSPMAMALYNHLTDGTDTYAISAGLYPCIGEPISDKAVAALRKEGVESSRHNAYDKHTACALTEEIISDCDCIIGLTEAHTLELIGRFPRYAQKIASMPKPINDPYGGDLECYKICLKLIKHGIIELFSIKDDNY